MFKRVTLFQCCCLLIATTCDGHTYSLQLYQHRISTAIHDQNSDITRSFVDDDWKYNAGRQLEEDEHNQHEDDELDEDGNNNGKQNTDDDDCITEKSYLAELVNHMLYTTPEEWTMNEIILGCCLALIALSAVLVTLCCIYGCCAAYCCCCCEGKKGRSKKNVWDDDTTVSGYGIDYQFTNESSLV